VAHADDTAIAQLRDQVDIGDQHAAGELCRRLGFPSIDDAIQRLWPDDISTIAHRALIEGLRPYILEPWEHELDKQRRRDT
jgi:hypothetical protein